MNTEQLQPLAEMPNAFAQHGEDAIVMHVLDRIAAAGNPLDKWLVDVGCSDGVSMSNSARLIFERGYAGLLLEADPERAELAYRNHAASDGVRVVTATVGHGKGDNILSFTSQHGCPHDCDFLSIDVDGMDYWLWADGGMRSKVVCIEFNHTIPPGCVYFQPAGSFHAIGSSLDAIEKLAASMGYTLVAVTRCNAIFCRTDLLPDGLGCRAREAREDFSACLYVFHGYDGTVVAAGNAGSPWVRGFDMSGCVLQPRIAEGVRR